MSDIMQKIIEIGEKLGYTTEVLSDRVYKACKITSDKLPMASFILSNNISTGKWTAVTDFCGTDVECGNAENDADCLEMLICFATGCSKADAAIEARRVAAELYAEEDDFDYDEEDDNEDDEEGTGALPWADDEETVSLPVSAVDEILAPVFERLGSDPKKFNDYIKSLNLGKAEKKFLFTIDEPEEKSEDKTEKLKELLKVLLETL